MEFTETDQLTLIWKNIPVLPCVYGTNSKLLILPAKEFRTLDGLF